MWRPTERWRGFNLDAKAIKDRFEGRWREDDLAMMHALGFNFARAMVDYRYLCAPGTDTPDPALFAPVDELLAWGRRHAIHVQLCLSIPPGTDYAISRSKKRTVTDAACVAGNVRCWDFMARRYRDIPDEALSFNLFNEPSCDCDATAYAAFIRACEQAIHAVSPTRLVIADGLQTARRPILDVATLPVGQSLHVYDPMEISHYKAPWANREAWPTPVWPPCPMTSPICGSRKKGMQKPLVFLDVPACHLEIVPGLVNRLAELVVTADGREVGRVRYQPTCGSSDYSNLVARTNGEWAGVPHLPIGLDVPASKRLEVGLDQGDWMEIVSLSFRADAGEARLEPNNQFPRPDTPRPAVRFAGFAADVPFTYADGAPFSAARYLYAHVFAPWEPLFAAGAFVMVGEFGVYKETPHDVTLAWLEDVLKELKRRNVGWALWNFRGPFGLLDSGRADAVYEDFRGHKLDRRMLELLKRY